MIVSKIYLYFGVFEKAQTCRNVSLLQSCMQQDFCLLSHDEAFSIVDVVCLDSILFVDEGFVEDLSEVAHRCYNERSFTLICKINANVVFCI